MAVRPMGSVRCRTRSRGSSPQPASASADLSHSRSLAGSPLPARPSSHTAQKASPEGLNVYIRSIWHINKSPRHAFTRGIYCRSCCTVHLQVVARSLLAVLSILRVRSMGWRYCLHLWPEHDIPDWRSCHRPLLSRIPRKLTSLTRSNWSHLSSGDRCPPSQAHHEPEGGCSARTGHSAVPTHNKPSGR